MSTSSYPPTRESTVIRVRAAPSSAAARVLQPVSAEEAAALSTLGGAAHAAGGIVQYGDATAGGRPRPAVLLRMAIDHRDKNTIDKDHERALWDWLTTILTGTELRRGNFSWVTEGAGRGGSAVSLGKSLSTIQQDLSASLATEDGTNDALSASVRGVAPAVGEDVSRVTAKALNDALAATPTGDMITAATAEVAEEVGALLGEAASSVVGTVTEVIAEVLDYIPGVAILSSAFKVVKSTVKLAMQAVKRLGFTRIVDSSISVIEREALWSADWYVEREQEAEGLALGTAVLTGAAHAAGYAGAAAGPVAKAIGALAALTHKIVKLVADILRVRRFNRARADGRRMDLQQLQDAPVLGLYLPHLPGCGGLHVLGVVPPGWNAADHTDEAELLRAKLQHPGNRDLLDSLSSAPPRMGGSAAAAARAVRQNPWSEELKRLTAVYEATDEFAYDFPWKIYKDGKEVYTPKPVTIIQKGTEFWSNAGKSAWQKIKSIPGALGIGSAADATDGTAEPDPSSAPSTGPSSPPPRPDEPIEVVDVTDEDLAGISGEPDLSPSSRPTRATPSPAPPPIDDGTTVEDIE